MEKPKIENCFCCRRAIFADKQVFEFKTSTLGTVYTCKSCGLLVTGAESQAITKMFEEWITGKGRHISI